MSKDLKFRDVKEPELVELQKNFDMAFSYRNKSMAAQYCHSYKNGTSEFLVIATEEIPEDLKDKFISAGTAEEPIYFFQAEIDEHDVVRTRSDEAMKEKIRTNVSRNKDFVKSQLKSMEALKSKTIEMPFVSDSKIVAVENIADLMAEKFRSGKKVHFFTGAGISGSSIPDWNSLMKLIGFDREVSTEENLNEDGMQVMMKGIHDKHHAFISGLPSSGHEVVGNISKSMESAILTDNRDLLHQGSGCDSIHVNQISNFAKHPWAPEVTCDPREINMGLDNFS